MKYAILIAFSLVLVACAEEGESGTSPIDCGDHGTEHDGHCHCDDGYLFDGETCVTPEEITAICEEHEEGEDESHGACVCPDEGECPCDNGEIETHGDHDYCVPELHEE
jgi:hypothetical protein